MGLTKPRGRNQSPIDIRHQEGFVAVSAQRVIGFVTLYVAEGRLHIGWLGVARKFHKQGIGAQASRPPQRKKRVIWELTNLQRTRSETV